jgi:hypothetical protein
MLDVLNDGGGELGRFQPGRPLHVSMKIVRDTILYDVFAVVGASFRISFQKENTRYAQKKTSTGSNPIVKHN